MLAVCVATVEAGVASPGRNNQPAVVRHKAVEERPSPGTRFKFQPSDGSPLAPGTYLLVGRLDQGVFTDNGRQINWSRITGQALAVNLGDADKVLSAALAKLSK